MRIVIAAVGRLRPGPEKDLFDHYRGRLLWPLELHEIEDRRRDEAGRPAREAALLQDKLPADAVRVALDETGQALASRDFAARLGAWRDAGTRDVAFLLGGADGLDPALRATCALVLSFGRLTWPHLLARAMLAEQLYRAERILAGHPYHRD